MKVICSFYENQKRLSLVLGKIALRSDVVAVPVRGSFLYAESGVRCVGSPIEILTVSGNGEDTILLTTNPEYKESNKQVIEYSLTDRDSIYAQALNLCVDKSTTSKNPFTMECAVEGATVVADCNGQETTCTLKAPNGVGILGSVSDLFGVHDSCKHIKKFKYISRTNTCDKEVAVSRGQVDIFREIAHYLNRAIIFVRVENDQVVREQVITATGCCEMVTRSGVSKVVKVPFTRMAVDPESYIFAIDAPLDQILKSTYLLQPLAGGFVSD